MVEMVAKGTFVARLKSSLTSVFSCSMSYLFIIGKHTGKGRWTLIHDGSLNKAFLFGSKLE